MISIKLCPQHVQKRRCRPVRLHSPFSTDNERSEASERDLQERLKAAGDSDGIDMRALTQELAGGIL